MENDFFTLVYSENIADVIEEGRIFYKHKMYEFDTYHYYGNSYRMCKCITNEDGEDDEEVIGELSCASNTFIYRKMEATDDVPEHFWFMEVVE